MAALSINKLTIYLRQLGEENLQDRAFSRNSAQERHALLRHGRQVSPHLFFFICVYQLVVVDRFSKFAHFIPLAHQIEAPK